MSNRAFPSGVSATVSLHVDDLRRMVETVDKKRVEEQVDPNMVGW